MSPCPSDATLRSLGTDALADAGYAAIEEHVENCPQCKAALERLVRAGPGSPDCLPDPEQSPQIPGFEIQRELGRGPMSVVYQAWQPRLKRHVALKIVRSGPGFGSRERDRWLREAQAYTCVRHPNVVPLHEAGEAGPWLYLVLEYMPGGSLKHRLDVPYAAGDAARLLEAIARAVAAIHAEGLVHLDLKPSNIMLDLEPGQPREEATPRVGDFGISLRWTDPDASLATDSLAGPLGTPSYMAPEQVTGDRAAIGPAADIYGMGALFYHVLTGRPPFSAPSVAVTLEQVRDQEPVPPRRLIPQIPRDLETIALKCLQKNPSGRYTTAEAVADDLHRWLDGRPISARPVSPIERIGRWCGRRPVIAALAAALTLVLSIGLLAAVLLWRHAEAERRRAEDELLFADRLLSEITAIGHPGLAGTLGLTRNNVIGVLQRTREHILQLRTQDPNDSTACNQLALVDLRLASHLAAQKSLSKSRTLLAECLRTLDLVLKRQPHDQTAIYRRFIAYWCLATVADREGNTEESLVHLEQAVALGQQCLRRTPDAERIEELANCRWSFAQALCCQGKDERAKSVILANLRMLDEVSEADRTPTIVIWRTLGRLDLHQFKAGLSSAPTSRPDQADAMSRLASSDADTLDAESWAELVARSLSSGRAGIDLTDSDLSDFVDHLSARISCQRRLGRIDDACRSTERMHAFARLLAARHPGQPAAYLALSAAFVQMAKHAWTTHDRLAVKRNWKLALDEARRALVLDPHNARASAQVGDLQRRLDLLVAPEPDFRDRNRSVQTARETGR